MMDIKESIKNLIKQSTALLNKLEDNEDIDESSTEIEIFDKIIEDSKNISTQFKSKRSQSHHNGNKSSGDDSRPAKIKLVPIEKLIQRRATVVLEKAYIELSDSDNEVLVSRSRSKPKSSVTDTTSKANILKNVFSHVKESASKVPANTKTSCPQIRSCRVNVKRVDLHGLVASLGLELMPTLNDRPAAKSSNTVRCFAPSHLCVRP